jgi:hypothetical protein
MKKEVAEFMRDSEVLADQRVLGVNADDALRGVPKQKAR